MLFPPYSGFGRIWSTALDSQRDFAGECMSKKSDFSFFEIWKICNFGFGKSWYIIINILNTWIIEYHDEYINKLAKMVCRSIGNIFWKSTFFEKWQDFASGARGASEGTGATSCHFSKKKDFQKMFPIDLHTILANLFIYSSSYSIIHVFSIFMIIYIYIYIIYIYIYIFPIGWSLLST